MASRSWIGAGSALTLAAILVAGSTLAGDFLRDTRSQIGFEVAASQHITLDPNVPSQGLGSYLVTVSIAMTVTHSQTLRLEAIPLSISPSRLISRTTWPVDACFPRQRETSAPGTSPPQHRAAFPLG